MDDQPPGPGWWKASDGQWYPPEQHPSAAPPPPPSQGWEQPGQRLPAQGWSQPPAAQPPQIIRVEQKSRRGCMWWFGLAAAIGAVIVVIAIIAVAVGVEDTSERGRDDVSLTSCAREDVLGFIEPKGEATNPSSEDSDYFIDIAIETPAGVQLDTTLATLRNVRPDQTAQWEALPVSIDEGVAFECVITDVRRTASL